MSFSRRNLFRRIAVSVFASSAFPSLTGFSASIASRTGASGPADPILLDNNENAYGPSKKAAEAMRSSIELTNRYPGAECDSLTAKIAAFHNVRLDQVTLGAGAREILRMATAALLHRGQRLILGSPTFDPIARFAQSEGAEVVAIPLNKRYEHDLDGILAHVNSSTGLIYICNPNNPTGTLTPRKDLDVFLGKVSPKVTVLIDEAYHQYVENTSDYASFIDHPSGDSEVIVLRTFSKIYGLAGLRVGYAVSSPKMASSLASSRLQWGVNVVAARAAAASLGDTDFVRLSAKRNADDRQELFNQSNARMLRWIDSHTNFVMLNAGLPPKQIVDHFQKHNISLGPLIPEMPKYIRVSIGTTEEMREFWRVWDLLPPHPMAM